MSTEKLEEHESVDLYTITGTFRFQGGDEGRLASLFRNYLYFRVGSNTTKHDKRNESNVWDDCRKSPPR